MVINGKLKKDLSDQKGNIYSLELDVTNSVEVVASLDKSSLNGVDDETSLSINYIYPPKEKSMVMSDGLSNDMFEKRNMEQKLKEKVRRRNKLVMEIQGSIILTSTIDYYEKYFKNLTILATLYFFRCNYFYMQLRARVLLRYIKLLLLNSSLCETGSYSYNLFKPSYSK